MLACGAAALLLGLPASASAGGFVLDFGASPAWGLQVYDFSDCAGYCAPQPISVTVERAGTVVASAPADTRIRVAHVAQPGDIVHIFRDGVERASVPYEGGPVIDGPGCLPAGTTVLAGTLRRGDPDAEPATSPPDAGDLVLDPQTRLKVFRLPEERPATLTGAGNRWRAELARPLDGPIGSLNEYRIATPVGSATVWTWASVDICGREWEFVPPPYSPPPCRAPVVALDPRVAPALEKSAGRLRLRALRRGRARLDGVRACPGGTVTVTVTARKAVVARAHLTAAGEYVAVPLTRTRRAKRLKGRRRADATVTVRIVDAGGESMTWSKRLTLR
jgi:hypothetical protein